MRRMCVRCFKMAHSSTGGVKGRLMAVIGDEVSWISLPNAIFKTSTIFLRIQDTCTGFLLGGIGEINAKRQKNFLVVTKGKVFL